MKKEIIGYRLVKPEYYKSASQIMFDNELGCFSLDSVIPVDFHALPALRAAGVLDLWFEPVYKEPEIKSRDEKLSDIAEILGEAVQRLNDLI